MPWSLLSLGLFIIFLNGFSDGIWSINVKIVVLQQASSSFKRIERAVMDLDKLEEGSDVGKRCSAEAKAKDSS